MPPTDPSNTKSVERVVPSATGLDVERRRALRERARSGEPSNLPDPKRPSVLLSKAQAPIGDGVKDPENSKVESSVKGKIIAVLSDGQWELEIKPEDETNPITIPEVKRLQRTLRVEIMRYHALYLRTRRLREKQNG